MAYELFHKTLFTLSSSPLSTTIGASADSGFIETHQVSDVLVMLTAPNAPTGTTPTLDVYLDGQDDDQNVYLGLLHLTQLTAAGQQLVSAGLHIASPNSMVLPRWLRLRWVIGGSNSPQFTKVSLTLAGR